MLLGPQVCESWGGGESCVCVSVCTHRCMSACNHTLCLKLSIQTHTVTHTRTHTHTQAYTHAHTTTHTRTHTHAHTQARTHKHTHSTNTHTHTRGFAGGPSGLAHGVRAPHSLSQLHPCAREQHQHGFWGVVTAVAKGQRGGDRNGVHVLESSTSTGLGIRNLSCSCTPCIL